MLVKNTGRVQKKKVPLSRRITPDTGSGRINAPHGGRYLYLLPMGIKKSQRQKSVGNISSPVSNVMHCKYMYSFQYDNKKAELFMVPPVILFIIWRI